MGKIEYICSKIITMNTLVLYYKHSDRSGMEVVRTYAENNEPQAQKDLKMMKEYASSDKDWFLISVELFNGESVE